MHDEDLILVTGATGNTGSALLQQLEGRGARVRAMVRSDKDEARLPRTAATAVVANFDDPHFVDAALEGVTHVYLVTPSSQVAEAQQVRFAERAAAAGVRHLVKLSQFAADEASPVRFLRYHAAVERRIHELGIGFTFLRPNLYFQSARIPVDDCQRRPLRCAHRRRARQRRRRSRHCGGGGRRAHRSGPRREDLRDHRSRGCDAQRVGRRNREGDWAQRGVVDVPPQTFAAALKAAGVPSWQVDGLIEDYAHYARGEAAVLSPDVRAVTDVGPRDMATFARDYAGAFIGA
jgi:NmrA-like family